MFKRTITCLNDRYSVDSETLQEAKELIEKLQIDCQGVEDRGLDHIEDEDIHNIFRGVHTLKGLAHMLGRDALLNCLHKLEDTLQQVREHRVTLTTKRFEALQNVVSLLESPFCVDDEDLLSFTTAAVEEFVAACEEKVTESSGNQLGGRVKDSDSLDVGELTALKQVIQSQRNLFSVILEGCRSVEETRSQEVFSQLASVVDMVAVRNDGERSLVIFGSDLEVALLEGIAECPVLTLEMGRGTFTNLPEEWEIGGLPEENEASSEPGLPHREPTPSSAKRQRGEPEQQSFHIEVEDFDSTNRVGEMPEMELEPELLEDFLVNSEELLEEFGESILALEEDPNSTDAVEAIFRAAHTIKGTAGMFGFHAIEKLTHIMENLFDAARQGKISVTPEITDGVLLAFDKVKEMFQALHDGESPEIPINSAIQKMSACFTGRTASEHQATAVADDSTITAAIKPVVQPQAVEKGETSIQSQRGTKEEASKAKTERKKKIVDVGGGTIRVDLKRLDSLVNLVGELVIDRTRFARIEEELRLQNANSELCHSMSETVLLFGRHMNEVQSIIMKIRMVPVGNAFHKFTRVVRDLARQVGKSINLHIEGGETELDKTLVEEIADPLVHLIRNAVDHGIEKPEDRVAAGKDPTGNIHIKASQDGNMIVISVADDGKGLPPAIIRQKGIRNGLIQESDNLSHKEIFNLIFEPGFSTAEKVTNISGRGVGMDVVKKNIVKLKGVIEVDSELGKGACMTVKLPLTLAIIPSLMVETNGESYAIPLVNVVESIRITPDEIQKIGNSDFVKLREKVLPIMRLSQVFNLERLQDRMWYRTPQNEESVQNIELKRRKKGVKKKKRIIFVVVGVGEKRVGLIVDQLLGQQEIVIKSLGSLLGRIRGVAGGCVLGNGCVSLVVDVGEIIEDFSISTQRRIA